MSGETQEGRTGGEEEDREGLEKEKCWEMRWEGLDFLSVPAV